MACLVIQVLMANSLAICFQKHAVNDAASLKTKARSKEAVQAWM